MAMRVIAAIVAVVILATGAAGAEVRRLRLATTAMVSDPVRDVIYATTPGAAGPGGNRVVTILPESVAVAGSPLGAFVGSEPAVLAIDGDATVLFVGLRGANAVTRVALDPFTVEDTFSLGAEPFYGPLYAQDIAIAPGMPETVAIALASFTSGPAHRGVAVFDAGVRRPIVTPGHTGSNAIAFLDDPTRLYGINNESTEFGFRRMKVEPTGVGILDVTDGIGQDFSARLERDGDRLVTTSGVAIAPEASPTPTILGTYFVYEGVGGYRRPNGPVEASGLRNRVYYAHRFYYDDAWTLLVFDRSTFVLLDALYLPFLKGAVHSVVAWGSDGVALATREGDVALVGSNFAPCVDDTGCDDGDACTIDVCGDGTCLHEAVTCEATECGDTRCVPDDGCVVVDPHYGQPCTDDGNPCTYDTCGVSGCEHPSNYSACEDDGDPCTSDACGSSGTCEHKLAYFRSCEDDGDPCTSDMCGLSGKCEHTPSPGTYCTDDDDPCTFGVCGDSGACELRPAPGNYCEDDGDPCTFDVCGDSGCEHRPGTTGHTCEDDGNPCTMDVCGDSGCEHPPLQYTQQCDDDGDACTADVCGDGTCLHEEASFSVPDYFVCSLTNLSTALRRQALCSDRCLQRLRTGFGELELAVAVAFNRYYEDESECRLQLAIALQRAKRLVQTAQRLRKRDAFRPGELGKTFVQSSRDVVRRLRSAVRTMCPLASGG